MLLNLLKSSYTSSLHSADLRLSTLTQEVTSLRAQNTYLETKLRSLEILVDSANKANDEGKKRHELLQDENVRLKTENQQLKAENEQLVHFKSILLTAANGMSNPNAMGLPMSSSPPLNVGGSGVFHSASNASLMPTLSSNDFGSSSMIGVGGGSTIAASATNQATAPTGSAHPSFYFSPLKRAQPTDANIGIASMSHVPLSSTSAQVHATPYQAPKPSGTYHHVMPSPLTADALASPMPLPKNEKNIGKGKDILQEINASLSSRSGIEWKAWASTSFESTTSCSHAPFLFLFASS